MPNKTFNVRLQVKKDTEDNWNTNNPVLLANELIIVETNDFGDRFKIGDGTSTYSELPFQDENIRELITNVEAGGAKIAVQSSQPSGQVSGDFWYQTT